MSRRVLTHGAMQPHEYLPQSSTAAHRNMISQRGLLNEFLPHRRNVSSQVKMLVRDSARVRLWQNDKYNGGPIYAGEENLYRGEL